MRIRIRLQPGRARHHAAALNRQAAMLLATLLVPVSLMAWALAAWRLMYDVGLAGQFVFSEGLLSRWQVWMALAIAIQFLSYLLHRYGRRDDPDGELS